jgi:hypothetical protein
MKIVFLDIDGVLNDSRFNAAAESSSLLRPAVERLNQILRASGAKLVLSSSWRYLILERAMTVEGFEYLLRTHGLDKGCLIGHTGPDAADEGDHVSGRAAQIRAWLAASNHNVTAWVALDDGVLDLGDDRWRQVKTDGTVGLTDDDARAAIAILT